MRKYIFDTNALILLAADNGLLARVDFNNIFMTNMAKKELVEDFLDSPRFSNLSTLEQKQEYEKIETLMDKILKKNILELDYDCISQIQEAMKNTKSFNLKKERGLNDIVLSALSKHQKFQEYFFVSDDKGLDVGKNKISFFEFEKKYENKE